MRPVSILVFLILVVASGAGIAQPVWTGTPLEGGRVTRMTWKADGSLWAIAAGAAFRSVDEGVTWERRSDGMVWTTRELEVADDGTLFAASSALGIPRIFRSLDDGATWTETTGPGTRSLFGFAVTPADSSTWMFADGTELWRTTNSGASWGSVATAPGGATSPTCQPGSSTVCLLGASADGVFKSSDGGATWAASSTGIPGGIRFELFEFDPATPSTVYAIARNDDGVFRSMDSGDSWTAASTGLPADLRDIDDLAIVRGATGELLAVVVTTSGTRQLFGSADAGSSWNLIHSFTGSGPTTAEGVAPAGSSVGATTLVVGTGRGIERSLDGGSSFAESNTGLAARQLSRIAGHAASPARLYASSWRAGPYVSTDGGTSWEERTTGLPAPGAYTSALDVTPDDDTKAVLAHGDDLYVTIDSGLTWTPQMTDLAPFGDCGFLPETLTYSIDSDDLWVGHNACHIPLAAANAANASAANGRAGSTDATGALTSPEVLVSDDDGVTWAALFDLPPSAETTFSAPIGRLVVDPGNTEVALVSSFVLPGQETVVRRTIDRGLSWADTLVEPASLGYLAMAQSDPSRIYLGREGIETSGGTTDVLRSDDGGASWAALASGLECVTSIAVDPADADVVYVGCVTVHESRDGGATWVDLGREGLPDPVRLGWLEVLELGEVKTLMATTNTGIFTIPLDHLFADGFESGDTSAWSTTVGVADGGTR